MKPTAETQAIISAPIQKVWSVMTNTNAYAQWNPFVVKVESNGNVTQLDTKMKFYVRWNNGKGDTSDEWVTDVKLPVADDKGVMRAHWAYRFNGVLHYLGLVRAVRYHWLEEKADGTTLYSTREEFSGLLKGFIPLADVQDGFERQTKAMKGECER